MKNRMKNGLIIGSLALFLIATFGLTGAIVAYSSEKDCAERFEGNSMTFEYPCTWKTQLDERMSNWVFVIPTDQNNTFGLIYPAQSFAEYETEKQDQLLDGTMTVEDGTIVINGKEYTTKEYRQHGGRTILVEMGDAYLGINSEFFFVGEVEEGVNQILDSLEVK